MAPSALSPPEMVRGMTIIDESKFTKEISVPVLKISETCVGFIVASLKSVLLKLEKFKPIRTSETNAKEKLIYLNPDLVSDFNSLNEKTRNLLFDFGISEELNFQRDNITLRYENWKCHDIIAAILPKPLSFSGFSTIGSIIHVNLRDQLLPYKDAIGQVLLGKVKSCKSVVNKVKSIDNPFRNFELEVIAGENDLETEIKENGCRFRLNFANVYWNPRLHDEHGRILRKLTEKDVLYDVCCGIGPFAIPAARMGCHVLANDLNPECCRWLRHNMIVNKVPDERLRVFNKCGASFIREDIRRDLLERVSDENYRASTFHITMNLPDSAANFLPAFVGLFNDDELAKFSSIQLPVVHFYCFMKDKEKPEVEAQKLVERRLGVSLRRATTEVFNVRNVAPNKEMIRVTFSLPKEVLGGINTEKIAECGYGQSGLAQVGGMEWENNDTKSENDDVKVIPHKRIKMT